MLEILSGFGFLIIAFFFFRLERNTYKNNINDYSDIGKQIKFYGLIFICIIVAILLFIGIIKF